MFNLRIGLVGQPGRKLHQAARKIRPALLAETTDIMHDIWRRATRKVSGEVLKVRTGHLRRSLGPPRVVQTGSGVAGVLGARAIYARIHEEGGVVHVPALRPVRAKALRFTVGGETIFAKRTRAHDVQMPKRPFLRPSFEEELPRANERLRQAVIRTVNEVV